MKPLSGKEFARLLERNGWSLQRVQGSRHIFAKFCSKVQVLVPIHGNRPLKVGLQSYLMKLANATPGD